MNLKLKMFLFGCLETVGLIKFETSKAGKCKDCGLQIDPYDVRCDECAYLAKEIARPIGLKGTRCCICRKQISVSTPYDSIDLGGILKPVCFDCVKMIRKS